MRNAAPHLGELLSELSDRSLAMLESTAGEPRMARPHEGLLVLSHRRPTALYPQEYDPVVCLVLQGAKETNTTERSHPIADGQFMVVTHAMPVLSRITQASPQSPYLALIVSLQREILADLQRVARTPPAAEDDPYALRVGTAGVELVDAFSRYLRALDSPEDSEALAPLAQREIHYRVLNSPEGNVLRRILLGARPVEPIAQAIDLIRDDLAARLSVNMIASHVGLSPSALHHHFKAVTGTSPVQYQKQLRLLEARRLIQSNTQTVTGAAFCVGYASPTQFSREYSRAFGHPPSKDRVPFTEG
jgi:AraC-like DNA-binding protein